MPGAHPSTVRPIGETVSHGPDTHWYFKCRQPIAIEELVRRLELEHNPVFSPHPSALYVECGEPGEICVFAVLVKRTLLTCVFAVNFSAIGYVERALTFADPVPPMKGVAFP